MILTLCVSKYVSGLDRDVSEKITTVLRKNSETRLSCPDEPDVFDEFDDCCNTVA